jgi:hypothetical protein
MVSAVALLGFIIFLFFPFENAPAFHWDVISILAIVFVLARILTFKVIVVTKDKLVIKGMQSVTGQFAEFNLTDIENLVITNPILRGRLPVVTIHTAHQQYAITIPLFRVERLRLQRVLQEKGVACDSR